VVPITSQLVKNGVQNSMLKGREYMHKSTRRHEVGDLPKLSKENNHKTLEPR
jgi:hypothetical protein